jgi:transcriptional regulator with XRE-family HTH domain
MPTTDTAAKTWELALAERFGIAVRDRRSALGLSAQQVADRTRGLGYPITRVTISKIEGNMRSGKIDVAEMLVLAVALDIPPALLLLPEFPDGEVEIVPGRTVESTAAAKWLAGRRGWQVGPDNAGTQLVEAVVRRTKLEDPFFDRQLREHAREAPTEDSEDYERIAERVAEVRRHGAEMSTRQIDGAKASLWGESGDA